MRCNEFQVRHQPTRSNACDKYCALLYYISSSFFWDKTCVQHFVLKFVPPRHHVGISCQSVHVVSHSNCTQTEEIQMTILIVCKHHNSIINMIQLDLTTVLLQTNYTMINEHMLLIIFWPWDRGGRGKNRRC